MVDIHETVTHGTPSAKLPREVSPFGLMFAAGALITHRFFCFRIRVAGGCVGSSRAWSLAWWSVKCVSATGAMSGERLDCCAAEFTESKNE